jgi:hypothetical protein
VEDRKAVGEGEETIYPLKGASGRQQRITGFAVFASQKGSLAFTIGSERGKRDVQELRMGLDNHQTAFA